MNTLLRLLLVIIFCSICSRVIADDVPSQDEKSQRMIEVLGCMGCHKINGSGGSLAIDLTLVGSWKSIEQIQAQLTADPASREKGFMPSYRSLPEKDLHQISSYLYNLK